MDLGLKKRVALVTGSSDGIGYEIAYSLAQEGVDVIIHGKNQNKIIKVAEIIRRNHKVRSYHFAADVGQPKQIEYWFQDVMPTIGQLDILVNNIGGIAGIKKFEEISDQEWYDSFTFNFMSAVRFTRLALPYLKQSDQARIINLGTESTLQPGCNSPQYSASKTALVNLSSSLSASLAEHNILVNTICPSTIRGGSWYRKVEDISKTENISLRDAEKKLEELASTKVPLKRVGLTEEVANMVVLLASKQASYITGETIFIDGGTKRSIF